MLEFLNLDYAERAFDFKECCCDFSACRLNAKNWVILCWQGDFFVVIVLVFGLLHSCNAFAGAYMLSSVFSFYSFIYSSSKRDKDEVNVPFVH